MPISPQPQKAQKAQNDANAMSDHNVQVDVAGSIVSQNLQGPYAIKRNKSSKDEVYYTFDLPEKVSLKKEAKNQSLKQIARLTGLNDTQTTALWNAITAKPTTVESFFERLGVGAGDELGEGKHRLSLETNDAYKARMTKQITHLKESVDGDANILSIQEQPYDSDDDKKRQSIFNEAMKDAGYYRASNTLPGRDVGIWAKYDNTKQPPPPSPPSGNAGQALVNLIGGSPYRGCAAILDDCLVVNLHMYTQGLSKDEQVNKLVELKNQCDAYAEANKPRPLKVSITGDMNLYQPTADNIGKLRSAGYTLEKVKGHDAFLQPSYEAHIPARLPAPTQSSTASINQGLAGGASPSQKAQVKPVAKPKPGGISYLEGTVDNLTLSNKGTNSKKTVLIFPGNTGHHNQDGSAKGGLFGPKTGAGLAQASAAWGNADNPTLSLPTTGMDDVSLSQPERDALKKGAIKELYKAVGEGYQLVLPVRKHNDSTYFKGTLAGSLGNEPSFWGQNNPTANLDLAQFYIGELNKLHQFTLWMANETTNSAQITAFQTANPQLWQAYEEGFSAPSSQASQTAQATPANDHTAGGFTPSEDVQNLIKRLRGMKYPNQINSMDNAQAFSASNTFKYKMDLDDTKKMTVEGDVKNDGSGEVTIKGEWTSARADEIAKHFIYDLGWTTIDLLTTGDDAIPKEYVDQIINVMRQEAKMIGKDITVEVDGVERAPAVNTPTSPAQNESHPPPTATGGLVLPGSEESDVEESDAPSRKSF